MLSTLFAGYKNAAVRNSGDREHCIHALYDAIKVDTSESYIASIFVNITMYA